MDWRTVDSILLSLMEIHDGRSLLLFDGSLLLLWGLRVLRVLRSILGHLLHLLMHLLLLLMLLMLLLLMHLLVMLVLRRQLLVLLLLLCAQMLCPLDGHELGIQLRIPRIRVRLALSLHQRPFLHPISTHRYSPNCSSPGSVPAPWPAPGHESGWAAAHMAAEHQPSRGVAVAAAAAAAVAAVAARLHGAVAAVPAYPPSLRCRQIIIRCVRQQRRGRGRRGRPGEAGTRCCGCFAVRVGLCVSAGRGVDIISMDLPPDVCPSRR
jgi:hypothetical protein